jgi:hypothetical protein
MKDSEVNQSQIEYRFYLIENQMSASRIRYFALSTILLLFIIMLIIISEGNRLALPPPVTISPSATITTIKFEDDCFDLDTGTVVVVPGFEGMCVGSVWDVFFMYDSRHTPHALLVQNTEAGIRVAYSTEPHTYNQINLSLLGALTFSDSLIETPFDDIAVIQTQPGIYYKIQLISENSRQLNMTFQWEKLQ